MMKTALLFVLLFLSFGSAHAQTAPPQGVIRYRTTIRLREQLAKQNKMLAAMLPETIDDTSEVYFKGPRFATVQNDPADVPEPAQGAAIPDIQEKALFDLATGSQRKEVTLNKRVYATVDTKTTKAKVYYRKETRTIAGYFCRAAIVVKDAKDWYLVWYAPALPYGYNPLSMELAAVKGAVLGYQMPEVKCEAIAVRLQPVPEAQLTANPQARVVTDEQLSDLTEDAMAPTKRLPAPGSKDTAAPSSQIIIRL